ncbi:hypothetical protein [Clostridium sp. CF012]|uniref:hypothetical protein n=1 Tax=Clostridium sp. CF012 TaxID=2843319 RepID=UPI001C0E5F02|nr:hypothetical protein [Clostridium sp. CF012]MBU3144606.1 hypothetical protein [Clostridium sp. CF012]
MKTTKTEKILIYLWANNGGMDLEVLYQLMNAIQSSSERHNIRGILSSLKARGLANNPKHAWWQVV